MELKRSLFAGKIVVSKSTHDSGSVLSSANAASDKVLVPGTGSNRSSTLAGLPETSDPASEDTQVNDIMLLVLLRLLQLLL